MPQAAYEGIIILGVPRSGTTLLRRILNAHPDVACPGETNILAGCSRLLQSETIAEGVDVGVLSGLEFAGFPEEVVLGRIREFAFGFHREFAARAGKRRWASKTAFDIFHLGEIERLCGATSRFVCIQRHGLDVACSLKDLCDTNGAYLAELHTYIKRHPRPLEAFSHAWVELTTALREFAARHTENAFLFKYEDLASNPEAILRQLASFAELEWSDQWLRDVFQGADDVGLGDWKTYATKAITAESVGRWRQQSRYAISMMGRICNPLLAEIGYETIAVEKERTPREARRRYEIGLRMKMAGKAGERPLPEARE